MQLDTEEGRVIGSLIEKQLTTPQQYPLTLNSLVLACNQSSNREPVVSYDERTVEQTLAGLKTAGLVRFVHPSHGRSVIRYRQVLDERLALDETELALVGVLLLRGPQTVGELRIRTERMASFDGIGGVETELGRLLAQPEPLVARLPRRPGQKEERWIQLLTAVAAGGGGEGDGDDRGSRPLDPLGEAERTSASRLSQPPMAAAPPPTGRDFWTSEQPEAAWMSKSGGSGAAPDQPAPTNDHSRPTLEALVQEVAELRAEVVRLRDAFEHLREQLGG